MREVVNETESLNEAFKTLIDNLDDPVDSTTAMQTIRNKDWEPGTLVDDYFYELRTAATAAKTPLRIACVVLITQLPSPVQGPVNDWLAEKEDVTTAVAREFIKKVRKLLVEKNIPLDQGHRDFGRVNEVRIEKETSSCELSEINTSDPSLSISSKGNKPDSDLGDDRINAVQRGNAFSRTRGRGGTSKSGWGDRKYSQRLSCYICGDTEHLQRRCPS